MTDATDAEHALKMELMQVDIRLQGKQAFWETPRNIAVLIAAVAAIAGAIGFKLGGMPRQPPIVIYLHDTATPAAQ
jgi:anti-sigma-K factor RskA